MQLLKACDKIELLQKADKESEAGKEMRQKQGGHRDRSRPVGAKRHTTLKGIQRFFFHAQIILIVTLALFLGVAGTLINIHFETQKRDRNLQNIAEAIASAPLLLSVMQKNDRSAVLVEYLDSLKETLDDIDVISVVNRDNIRIYHSNHSLIGTVYDGTPPNFDEGSGGFYTADEIGPSGMQRRACAAVYDGEDCIGFVMAIMLRGQIDHETHQTVMIFASITAVAVVMELILSAEMFRRVKRSLLGYEPDVFTAMYQIRDNILKSLDEGIVAIDRSGTVQFANDAAIAMLLCNAEKSGQLPFVGQKIDSFHNGALLRHTVESGEKQCNRSLGDANILMDSFPIKEDGAIIGAVGILHDRAEYTRLMEDLAGTRYLVDSMRANNHDFTNKLHVILGLIQMQRYEEAASYIQNVTMVQRASISQIMNAVEDPTVAALLIGKTARASELNVKFVLREGSNYDASDLPLPSDLLVTVIGNLIENAFEAMNENADYEAPKELLFGIYSEPGAVLITADDTGCGISQEDLAHIFENGYSTKGTGRGTGLYQVKTMVDSFGGKMSVLSQIGVGTSFSVSFTAASERE